MAKKIQQSFARIEKKYLLTPVQFQALHKGMEPHMKADEYGKYTICNLYYDTDDFAFIRASLEKPVYKEKLRLRSYGVPTGEQPVFVEIKKKFDHVVYKRRITLPCSQALRYLSGGPHPLIHDQIGREIDWFLQTWRPKPRVFIAYDREALAGIVQPDLRITFDTRLRWRNTDLDLRMGDQGSPLLPPDRILMEIKFSGAAPLWLSHLLSENGVFPTSFSKYGTCYRENLMRRAGTGWLYPVSAAEPARRIPEPKKEAVFHA
ncbi:MAG: polyphosphate polymerase domain-containing protein [Candidatus Heritagella sp.]